jgi:hypothetical protein
METLLLFLVALVLCTRCVPVLNCCLRKGIVEFVRGMEWYRDGLDEVAVTRLVRGLAWGSGLLAVLGFCALRIG